MGTGTFFAIIALMVIVAAQIVFYGKPRAEEEDIQRDLWK